MAYTHHDPHLTVSSTLAIIWIEFVLGLAFVGFRSWIQLRAQRRFTADDYLVFFALVCHFIMCLLGTLALPKIYLLYDLLDGKIRPSADFLIQQDWYLRIQFAMILLFWTILWAVKGSFMAFYKGLFSAGFQGWQRAAWWTTVAFCVLSYIGCWAFQFMSCSPFRNYFLLGSCESSRDINISNVNLYYSTTVDIMSDLLIMALPLSLLPKLCLNRRKKVALALLFCSGFVIIIFAILRLVLTLPDNEHVNPKWLIVLSATESSIAVMVSTAPPFRKLLTQRQRMREQTGMFEARGSQRLGSNGSSGDQSKKSSDQSSNALKSPTHFRLADFQQKRPPRGSETGEDAQTALPKPPRAFRTCYRRGSCTCSADLLRKEREKERHRPRARYDSDASLLDQEPGPYATMIRSAPRPASSIYDYNV